MKVPIILQRTDPLKKSIVRAEKFQHSFGGIKKKQKTSLETRGYNLELEEAHDLSKGEK